MKYLFSVKNTEIFIILYEIIAFNFNRIYAKKDDDEKARTVHLFQNLSILSQNKHQEAKNFRIQKALKTTRTTIKIKQKRKNCEDHAQKISNERKTEIQIK